MRELDYPHLDQLVKQVIEIWPDHEKFIVSRFDRSKIGELRLCEELVQIIKTTSTESLDSICEDYRWVCEMLLEEELYFRRNNQYRHSTFEEVNENVYSNDIFMKRYLNGLLLSQVLWRNHNLVLSMYIEQFVSSVQPDSRFLEIGPGHGLYLYFAAKTLTDSMLEAWDISESSIQNTSKRLEQLGVEKNIKYQRKDLLQNCSATGQFDYVVISEVLEHMESPNKALKVIWDLCTNGSRVFINVPCNSPAPDHIYLFRQPEDVNRVVKDAGFKIIDNRTFPLTGYTEEKARKLQLTISCVVIAEK